MTKRLSIIFPLLLLSTIAHAYGNYQATYLISACYPPNCSAAVPLTAYYKGALLQVQSEGISVKEVIDQREFYFLFTLDPILPESTTPEDRNTIHHFKMPESNSYLCYHLVRQQFLVCDKTKDIWTITQTRLKTHKKTVHIPEHTIIFLANPLYIQDLEQSHWDCEINTFKFPKIIFKTSISAHNFKKMNIQASCTACDLNAFHRKSTIVKESHAQSPHVVTSMVID